MQKIDLYTRLVLSVIAIALVGILVQNQILIERSQKPLVQQVGNPTEMLSPTAISVANRPEGAALIPQTADNTVYVYLKRFEDELDINLDEIGGASIYGSLPVTEK